MTVAIREDDLTRPEIVALLQTHQDDQALRSPSNSNHTLDLDGLRGADVTLWSAWQDGALLGCGALKELMPGHGEIKSMHTAAEHRGKGVAARLVEHILAEAQRRGYRRLSLETGSAESFAPARALYARFGFRDCPPFADYPEDPYSAFMTLELAAG